MLELNTFSIAARCRTTSMLGVAVSTAVPCVGGICSFIHPAAGAIATQSWVNPYLGIDGLELLKSGMSARQVLDTLLSDDPGREVRQIGIVDRNGTAAAFTGKECVDWAGHITGDGFTVQGNMLAGAAVVEDMAKAAEAHAAAPLYDRLMAVLEAGQAAGGDKRGKQSAQVKVYGAELYPYLDVRVDEHDEPVRELRRVLEIAKAQLLPFVDGMPKRHDPLGHIPAATTEMLMLAPRRRPQRIG